MGSPGKEKVARGRALSLREAETPQKATPTNNDIIEARKVARRIGGRVQALANAVERE